MQFQSAEMYIEMGKFGIPAKHHEAIALIYAKVCSKFSLKLFVFCSHLCKVGFCFSFFNFSCRCSLLCKCFFSNLFSLFTFLFCYHLCKGCSKFFPFPNFYCPRTSRYLDHKFDTLNTYKTNSAFHLKITLRCYRFQYFNNILIFFYCRRSVLQTTRQQSTT